MELTIRLLGGPYDGAYFPADHLSDQWWIRMGGDRRFGLLASPTRRAGERYLLSDFDGKEEAHYQHESLRTGVNTRWSESYA